MSPLRGLIGCSRTVPWVSPTAKLFRPLRGEFDAFLLRPKLTPEQRALLTPITIGDLVEAARVGKWHGRST